jgi:predicted PurR-regulated permease PerM
MAESTKNRLSIHLPWATLLKVVAAVAAIWMSRELAWVIGIFIIAVILAAALAPAVGSLERRGWPRSVAAWGLVLLIVGTFIGFLVITWSSLADQAQTFGQRAEEIRREVERRAPAPLLQLLRTAGEPAASNLVPSIVSLGRSAIAAAGGFALAWILVGYLLIESEKTYQWVRGFVPAHLRPHFDRTASEGAVAAHGYVVGNVITSACAGVYVFAWMTVLGVPGPLLLALIAFLADFFPVLGFVLGCPPAVIMAATVSPLLAVAMVPIFLAYDMLENYFIGPRVYGDQLRLSNLAVLVAFAIGAELGGIIGALVALPVAAVYPTIERLWLRDTFGSDVVEEHKAIARKAG